MKIRQPDDPFAAIYTNAAFRKPPKAAETCLPVQTMSNGLQRLPGGSLRFQQLIAEIDMAIRSSARFDDADVILIDQLNQIIDIYRDDAAAVDPPQPTIQLKAYNEK